IQYVKFIIVCIFQELTLLLNLTELSDEPLHNQISRQIWEEILSGDLPQGTELLPDRTLARTHHISRLTINRAYEDLIKEGLLVSENGSALFVAELTEKEKQVIARRRLFEHSSPLKVIDDFSTQLSSVFDTNKLMDILRQNLIDFLRIKHVYFALSDEKSGKFVISEDNADNMRSIKIDQSDKFIKYIQKQEAAVYLTDIKKNNISEELKKDMNDLNIQLIYPLKDTENFHGFLALSWKSPGSHYLKENLGVLSVLVSQFVTALTTANLYKEALEKRRMTEEMSLAHQIQRDLLPRELPDNGTYELAAYSKPSRTVGGDFYDYLPIDENHFGLVIADACGKGMPAAMMISQIQAILKSEVSHGNSIHQTIVNLNKHIKEYSSAQNFTTLFYGVFDKNSGILKYTNAGHNYPILIRNNGNVELLLTTGPALGIVSDSDFSMESVKLEEGDCLLMYTDGVTETMNEQKNEFGEKRLQDSILNNPELSADEIIKTVIDEIDRFYPSKELQDDRTLMILKIKRDK
ncbi:SpoIIE family protein phosphatase, partial [candidate division KSB1 bacterium]